MDHIEKKLYLLSVNVPASNNDTLQGIPKYFFMKINDICSRNWVSPNAVPLKIDTIKISVLYIRKHTRSKPSS